MDEESILERERQQIQQIRELEFEELQIEEVDGYMESEEEERNLTYRPPLTGAYSSGPFTSNAFTSDVLTSDALTFNPAVASLHTYLGEVEDTHHRLSFLDGGTILKLPLFYLEGVVLFPEAILPLRVIQATFIAAVGRALTQVDAPYTIGVVRVYRDYGGARARFAITGTTAEIRQYRHLEDGSLNLVTRGQQRFRLRRRWIDEGGAPCGEVQIIEEDVPLKIPKDACGKSGPVRNLRAHRHSHMLPPSSGSSHGYGGRDDESEAGSEESFESALSPTEKRIHHSVVDPYYDYDMMDELTSSDDDRVSESDIQSSRSCQNNSASRRSSLFDNDSQIEDVGLEIRKDSMAQRRCHRGEGSTSSQKVADLNQFRRVPKAFWPFWVYRMYDSYYLAQRAAGLWKLIVGAPNVETLVKKPDLLSFYIASKIPVSERTRQELLDIDGVSYRLKREIELLESFDCIRCKICKTVIAKRSDMMVMSSEGPLGAYVNAHGFVHEIVTLQKAKGIALLGRPSKEYSWFPGYAWTIANCATCETQLGWLFTGTKKNLKPEEFWAIRSSQVSDDIH